MYLKTFEDMQKTSVFFMLKPAKAIYGFIITICISIAAILVWAIFAPMDDVVKSTALLRPNTAVSSVKCVTSGQLYSKNFVNDKEVCEGDYFLTLTKQFMKQNLKHIEKNLTKTKMIFL